MAKVVIVYDTGGSIAKEVRSVWFREDNTQAVLIDNVKGPDGVELEPHWRDIKGVLIDNQGNRIPDAALQGFIDSLNAPAPPVEPEPEPEPEPQPEPEPPVTTPPIISPPPPGAVTVGNDAQLLSAVSAAPDSGATIVLASGGSFNAVTIQRQFSTELTIQSEDSSNPPKFSRFKFKNARNISLIGAKLKNDYTAGQTQWLRPFGILSSDGCGFEACDIEGDYAASDAGMLRAGFGYGDGGVFVDKSSRAFISNSNIHRLGRGIHANMCSDLIVSGCDIFDMSIDGIHMASCTGRALIDGNKIHDFNQHKDSGDHSDGIAWFNVTSTPWLDEMVIANNEFWTGAGNYMQCVYGNKANIVRVLNNKMRQRHNWGIGVPQNGGGEIAGNDLALDLGTNPNHPRNQRQQQTNAGTIRCRIDLSNASGNWNVHDNVTDEPIANLKAAWDAGNNRVA